MLNVFDFLNIITLLPSILGGLVIGAMLFSSFRLRTSDLYVMLISTTVFILLMAVTQFGLGNNEAGLGHWVGIAGLYYIFILCAFIGSKFKKPALFLNIL